ncbi:MAG: STAS domain-containing protein [Chloroflexota bacterium]
MEITQLNYRVSELAGWFVISPSGQAENNEPLRVRYMFRRRLSRHGVKVVVDLHDLTQLGVWEMGLLTSFKREVDQRGGMLRLCHLDENLQGYFHKDRFADQFDVYDDLESALAGKAGKRIP